MNDIQWMAIPTDQFLIFLMEAWMCLQMGLFCYSQIRRVVRERRRG